MKNKLITEYNVVTNDWSVGGWDVRAVKRVTTLQMTVKMVYLNMHFFLHLQVSS